MNHRTTPSAEMQAAEDAAEWVLAFESDEMDDIGRRREFVAWLKFSPVHVDEFLRASALHETLRSLPEFPGVKQLIEEVRDVVVPLPDQPHPPRAVQGDPETNPVVNAPTADAPTRRRFADWNRLAAAVAAVLIVVASLYLAVPNDSVYRTLSGETRSITLQDGSQINLDMESEVRVHISDASRLAEFTHGEVLFDVEEDAERRFMVDASELIVHVLGTRFNMRRDILADTTRTELTVIKGRVSVESTLDINLQAALRSTVDGLADTAALEAGKDGASTSAFKLSDGDQIIATNHADIHKTALVVKINDKFRLKNVSFIQMADVFNQQGEQRLVIMAPSLASRRITAAFSTRDIGVLLNFIARQPGVRVEHRGNTIYIHEDGLPQGTPKLRLP